MDLKELWNQDTLSNSKVKRELSFTNEAYESIDIFTSFEKKTSIIFRVSVIICAVILSIYLYIGFYELAIALLLILLLSTYISFSFLKRFKKNRFLLSLKEYLEETSTVLSQYIQFNLYGILFFGLLVVPSLYLMGVNSYFNSIHLFSFSIFKEYPGLFVGFGTGIIVYVFITLSVIYKVYYKVLKEINLEIKNLDYQL